MANASTSGVPVPIAASDRDAAGSPAAIEDSFKGGNQNPVALPVGVPLPLDAVEMDRPGSPAAVEDTFINSMAAYASSFGRRGMHSVGAPAVGPRGPMLPTIGPISDK